MRIIEIDWLANDLGNFYNYLNTIDDVDVFGNEFIRMLLEGQNYSYQIFFKVFLLQLAVIIINVVYNSFYVPNIPAHNFIGNDEDGYVPGVLRCIILANAKFNLILEIS